MISFQAHYVKKSVSSTAIWKDKDQMFTFFSPLVKFSYNFSYNFEQYINLFMLNYFQQLAETCPNNALGY